MNSQSFTTEQTTTTITSLVVHELTELEASELPLEEGAHYEILDEDRLTEHDFLSLMNSEEESSESESDVEDSWFPSLLKTSAIQFLEDESDKEEDDESEAIVEEEEDVIEDVQVTSSGKRSPYFNYQQRKRVKRSDQVPVEVHYIVL